MTSSFTVLPASILGGGNTINLNEEKTIYFYLMSNVNCVSGELRFAQFIK